MIRVADIIRAAADEAGLQVADLLQRSKFPHIARPRSRAMFLACRLRPDMSYLAIGRAVGGRDHTTVIHNERAVEKRLDEGDQAERVGIRETLSLLGLPLDLDQAVAAAERERERAKPDPVSPDRAAREQERREAAAALHARRTALVAQLGQIEQQLAGLEQGAPL